MTWPKFILALGAMAGIGTISGVICYLIFPPDISLWVNVFMGALIGLVGAYGWLIPIMRGY